MFSLVVLLGIAVYTDGKIVLTGAYYIQCPAEKQMPCKNIFYDPIICKGSTEAKCTKAWLMPGEYIGHMPSHFLKNITKYMLWSFIGCLFINHIFWMFYKRKNPGAKKVLFTQNSPPKSVKEG
jgi:hypothetical protein